jgi:hypothetical protein
MCRRRVGEAGREEVCLWDWRAATQHLLTHQYPKAMVAAAEYYGRRRAQQAAAPESPGAPAAAPAPA